MLGLSQGRLKIAATYKVIQPIENFVLRIRIVQQKSLLAELFETEGETQDTNYLVAEERDIAWQEKIFSPWETKFYMDEKNCITDLHKEYHDIIVGRESNEETRLHTSTQRDFFYPDKSILTRNYVTNLSKISAKVLPFLRNRKPFVERYNKQVVDMWPSESRIRENHCLYKDPTTMYILADPLSKDELAVNSSIVPTDSRILLCTITYDRAAKTLTINPDFTSDDFYTVETTGLCYDYWIEHASIQPNDDESKQRRGALRREVQGRRTYRDGEKAQEIPMPPANILRLYVNFEIVSARGFPYDALFITYHVDLPRHWATSDRERLTGRTQCCRMIKGAAHFSYISEIPLDFDLNCLNDVNVQPSWPYLILTVGSIDSWTRYRIEGYASVPLPPSSGAHSFDLPTWRPVGQFINVLRRFFTGGTFELEDVSYCGIPDTRESTRLEKARLKVTPGGSIRINLNIVHQSKLFAKNRSLNRDVERLSAGTLINSLDNVFEQFKTARERMIQARAQ